MGIFQRTMNNNQNNMRQQRPQRQDMQMSEEFLEMQATAFANHMMKYPVANLVMPGTLENLMSGCPWGFFSGSAANRDFVRGLEDIKNSKYFQVYELRQGVGKYREKEYLVISDMKYMTGILSEVYWYPRGQKERLYTEEDLKRALNKRQENIRSFAEFLKVATAGYIGIYNLNKGMEIVMDAKSYPAFAITLPDAMTLCKLQGFSMVVAGKKVNPDFILQKQDIVFKNLMLAPSRNALFIQISR